MSPIVPISNKCFRCRDGLSVPFAAMLSCLPRLRRCFRHGRCRAGARLSADCAETETKGDRFSSFSKVCVAREKENPGEQGPSHVVVNKEVPVPSISASEVKVMPIADSTLPSVCLLDLPDDVLRQIVSRLTHHRHKAYGEKEAKRKICSVQVCSLNDALPLAYTCKKMYRLMYSCMDSVCLWSKTLSNSALASLCGRAGPAVKRLVLRGCKQLTDDAVYAIAEHLPLLRSIDLSFLRNVTDSGIIQLCKMRSAQLSTILLRQCVNLTNASLNAMADCENLSVVDISYLSQVTDNGLHMLVVGCGRSLQLLSISHNVCLSDRSLSSISEWCTSLVQLCARGLPHITNAGFAELCWGIGPRIEGIDVLDCTSLTRDPVLRCIRKYCPRIFENIYYEDPDSKTLRQILVTTLRSNIFIVHGCDPGSGRETIHMVLVDNGDIVSANILSEGTTDLSLLGVVLCKSYGSVLDDGTKAMLKENYGILPSMLAD